MAGGGSGRQLVVGVTTELFLAGQDLLAVLDDEMRRGDAVERLVTVAESGIGGLASFGAQRFQAMEAGTPEERQEATDDVLATALGELTITHTLLATAAATGEQPTEGTPDEAAAGPAPGADRAVLQTSLAAAGAVPATVTPGAEPAPDAPSAEGRSADLAAAVDGLRKQLDATLDAIVARSAGAATKAFTGLLSFAPHVVKQVIDDLGKRVKLGAVTSRLFRAALWSLDQALGALQRLIPSRLLAGVRAQIQSVCDRLREEPATDVAIGAALGVGAVTEYAVVALNRTDLAVERLVDGTNELVSLGARYRDTMRLLDGVATAISLVAGSVALVHVVVPQLGLLTATAHALVAGTALVIGMDYVDSRPGPDFVRGVQTILRSAVE